MMAAAGEQALGLLFISIPRRVPSSSDAGPATLKICGKDTLISIQEMLNSTHGFFQVCIFLKLPEVASCLLDPAGSLGSTASGIPCPAQAWAGRVSCCFAFQQATLNPASMRGIESPSWEVQVTWVSLLTSQILCGFAKQR